MGFINGLLAVGDWALGNLGFLWGQDSNRGGGSSSMENFIIAQQQAQAEQNASMMNMLKYGLIGVGAIMVLPTLLKTFTRGR